MALNEVLIQNLTEDMGDFINGGASSNVSLSDGFILPSYRNFAINDLTRTGNSVQEIQYYEGDIVTFNNNMYLCLENTVVTDNSIEPGSAFKKVGNETKSGWGFSAIAEYNSSSDQIIFSKGIVSITKDSSTSTNYTVKLKDEALGSSGKIGFIVSYDARNTGYEILGNLDQLESVSSGSSPDSFYKKQVTGRVLVNGSNEVKLKVETGLLRISVNDTTGLYNVYKSEFKNSFNPVISFAFIPA